MAKRIRLSTGTALKLTAILAFLCAFTFTAFSDAGSPSPSTKSEHQGGGSTQQSHGLFGMTAEEATRRSQGCLDCHTGIEDMHDGKINLGCIDCHGGDASSRAALSPAGVLRSSTIERLLRFTEAKYWL